MSFRFGCNANAQSSIRAIFLISAQRSSMDRLASLAVLEKLWIIVLVIGWQFLGKQLPATLLNIVI